MQVEAGADALDVPGLLIPRGCRRRAGRDRALIAKPAPRLSNVARPPASALPLPSAGVRLVQQVEHRAGGRADPAAQLMQLASPGRTARGARR